jgi:hypothetical protein
MAKEVIIWGGFMILWFGFLIGGTMAGMFAQRNLQKGQSFLEAWGNALRDLLWSKSND